MDSKIQLGVSLFSFAIDIQRQKLSLEECVRIVSELGFEGVEIIDPQMLSGCIQPSDAWGDEFLRLLEKYRMDPFCYSTSSDIEFRRDMCLAGDEIIRFMINKMLYAKRLGFPYVSVPHAISPLILEKLIPYAEECGIWLGVEMLRLHKVNDPIWQEYIELFERSSSEHIGIIPDIGMFQTEPLEDLRMLIPYSRYMHSKFHNIGEKPIDHCVPCDRILPYLQRNGFCGYITSIHESQDCEDGADSAEQLKRHIIMEKQILKYK